MSFFQKLNKLEEALLKSENKKLPQSNGISDESDPNVTFIIDSEAENNPTTSSEAFRQFKELLENSANPIEALFESAKLMNMLMIGCDKGSVSIDAKYYSPGGSDGSLRKLKENLTVEKVRKSNMSDI